MQRKSKSLSNATRSKNYHKFEIEEVESEIKYKMLKTPRLEDHMMINIMKKYNVKFINLINL